MRLLILFMLSPLFLLSQTQLIAQEGCNNDTPNDTFEVYLPAINNGVEPGDFHIYEGDFPIYEDGHLVPAIWDYYRPIRPDIEYTPVSETIEIPNNRPIYALIVSGYANNAYLDEMMLYNFTRYLQAQGAYVHHAWWNNLLAPYMEKPLHHYQSYPGYFINDLVNFTTSDAARNKALPGEDYQFVADAKILLTRIREENPNAIIIVAGHSMGGGAIVHLAQETEELIDILAPIDPVGNRNLPFAGSNAFLVRWFNWTRWRVSRDGFKGFKKLANVGSFLNPDCVEEGDWLPEPPSIDFDGCHPYVYHEAPTIVFGSKIVNLHHRYQKEYLFPFDFDADIPFGHERLPGGLSTQDSVVTKSTGSDPGGWPNIAAGQSSCCPSGEGMAHPLDGHGEIVGHVGNLLPPAPLGVRFRTSPECGINCSGLNWPAREVSPSPQSLWYNGDGPGRKDLLMQLETRPLDSEWQHRPYNPDLCLVSGKASSYNDDGVLIMEGEGLIRLFEIMNKPPTATAGEDQIVECTGQDGGLVTLNGSASTDSDGDTLTYTWTGDFGEANGEVVDITLPIGSHCIKLKIKDLVGHIDIDWVNVEVIDTTGPELTVSLSPNLLWPPNHRLRDITATVEAIDLCGTVDDIVLYSITSSEFSNEIGSGNTIPDIVDATFNTEDLHFKLRAERSGRNGRRTYTVTYKATDNAGNSTFTSANVIVENPSNSFYQRYDENNLNTEEISGYTRNYPNPFSTTTSIEYYLPLKEHINITIYDLSGKVVDVLFNGVQEAGANSIIYNGNDLSSGVYFYRITSSNKTMINKMVKKR